MTTPTQLPLQQLEGILERVTFQNEENGYTVARLKCHGQTKEVTIVGTLSGANVGERLRLVGFWTNHPSYGRQFEVNTFSVHYPATVEGIRKYLGSGLVRGIGPVTAGKIVDVFGVDTLTVIEEEPHRLKEINGIGDKKIHVISQAWSEQKQIKEIMLFLQSHSVSSGLAVKIYMQYGDQSIPIVKADPYRLAKDIYGIGFITADRIARQLGLPPNSPARIRAGLSYCLSEFANDGNCFANRTQLLSKAKDLLNVDDCAVELQNLLSGEELLEEDDAIYLPAFFHAETGVANRIHRLQHSPQDRLSHLKHIDLPASIADFSNTSPIQLTDLQTQAVRMALTEKTSVLTGGPGTGKSTIIAAIIHILQRNRGSILLTAPTGRAAKRMTETTGIDARTIHRLLEYRPKEGKPFIRDNVNPLDADLIVVDEASMIDILLANHLLDAIEIGSHILFVGDVDQLPSVGPGNFLRDLIASNQVPVTRLDTIFRQAQDSYIILNAHRINTGLSPQFPANAADFFLFAESDPTKAADRVIELVSERIPNKFNFDPLSDIQVLCPMHRGSVGVTELNLRLQAKLNPSIPGKTELIHRHHQFRQGDRVMQIMNDYDLQVFNGDLGRITRIDLEDQVCQVDFDGRIVEYSFSALDELSHAYAVSIHKSQGSEFPVVVIPILTQHYLMLQRNLLYTAVTRARKLVVLVGSKEAIAIAVRNNRITQRNTRLAQRINKQTNRNSVSNSAEYSFAKQPKGSRK